MLVLAFLLQRCFPGVGEPVSRDDYSQMAAAGPPPLPASSASRPHSCCYFFQSCVAGSMGHLKAVGVTRDHPVVVVLLSLFEDCASLGSFLQLDDAGVNAAVRQWMTLR